MLRHKYSIVAILALTAITACKEDESKAPEVPLVAGVYDHSVDFSEYHSFDLVEADDVPADQVPPTVLTEANRITINDAIINEMESRGYVRDQVAPDLRLTTFVRLREVEVAVQSTYWYDYYYGWYWGYGYPWYHEDISALDAGTLVIDAVAVGNPDDEQDDMLVFRGTATELLTDPPTDMSKEIPGIVARIFELWPTS